MRPYYSDSAVTIYHGDAMEVLAGLEGSSAAAVITDPPYVIGAVSAGNMASKSGGWQDMMNSAMWLAAWYREVGRVLHSTGVFWTFCNWRSLPVVMRAWRATTSSSGMANRTQYVRSTPEIPPPLNRRSKPMGYMRHHAIIVSAGDGDWLDRARKCAADIGMSPTPIVESRVNGVRSFLVPPDGSKEGWPESERGDTDRAEFIRWLEAQRYEDHSSPLAWVEVQYGDDDHETKIVHHSDEPVTSEQEKA